MIDDVCGAIRASTPCKLPLGHDGPFHDSGVGLWLEIGPPVCDEVRRSMTAQLWEHLLDFTGPLEEELDPVAQWHALLDRVRWLVEAQRWACPELEYPDSGGPALPPELPRVLSALIHTGGAPIIRLDFGGDNVRVADDDSVES